MNLQSKFCYVRPPKLEILHFVSKRDGITDRRTDRRTIRLLDAPGGPFRPGAQNHFKIVIINVKEVKQNYTCIWCKSEDEETKNGVLSW